MPFVPINHIESHILSPTYNNLEEYPQVCLLLTGVTQKFITLSQKNIVLLGETLDDAVGETFDKVAKATGLRYPGGPEIEKKALDGNVLSMIYQCH